VKECIKKWIIDRAVENWYEIGKWRSLKSWVSAACKTRNELHPNKEAMYVRVGAKTQRDIFKKVLKMWYPIMMWFRNSWVLSLDREDAVLNNKDYKPTGGWHAISTYWSDKYDWMHVDTYPHRKTNRYSVEHWYELIDNGVYYWLCYAIFPAVDLAEKKKKKFMKVMIILAEMMKKMYVDENKKNELKKIQALLWSL